MPDPIYTFRLWFADLFVFHKKKRDVPNLADPPPNRGEPPIKLMGEWHLRLRTISLRLCFTNRTPYAEWKTRAHLNYLGVQKREVDPHGVWTPGKSGECGTC